MQLVAAHSAGGDDHVSRTSSNAASVAAPSRPPKPPSTLPQHGPRLCSPSRRTGRCFASPGARCAASGARGVACNLVNAHGLAFSRRRRPSFAVRFALIEKRGRREGRAPAGTQGPHAKNARGVTTGNAGLPAFPAQWFYGLWRALPGERCTIAPVALQMIGARTRSGRLTTASLDAQTPGVRTTRFCRPRTSLPKQSEARACSPPMPKRNAVTAPCRPRIVTAHGPRPALPSRHAPALPRPSHPSLRIVTIAKRPFDGPGWSAVYPKPRIRSIRIFCAPPLPCMWRVLPAGQRVAQSHMAFFAS
ncbi:hypothetical protein ACVIIV_006624 [Bradyrhizobium sp. USDA 4354]